MKFICIYRMKLWYLQLTAFNPSCYGYVSYAFENYTLPYSRARHFLFVKYYHNYFILIIYKSTSLYLNRSALGQI